MNQVLGISFIYQSLWMVHANLGIPQSREVVDNLLCHAVYRFSMNTI